MAARFIVSYLHHDGVLDDIVVFNAEDARQIAAARSYCQSRVRHDGVEQAHVGFVGETDIDMPAELPKGIRLPAPVSSVTGRSAGVLRCVKAAVAAVESFRPAGQYARADRVWWVLFECGHQRRVLGLHMPRAGAWAHCRACEGRVAS